MEGLISPSRYHCRTPITEKAAIELANMSGLETIQFHNVKQDVATLQHLNPFVFKHRIDTTFRIYGYNDSWQDISFLKFLPEAEKIRVRQRYFRIR